MLTVIKHTKVIQLFFLVKLYRKLYATRMQGVEESRGEQRRAEDSRGEQRRAEQTERQTERKRKT